ncbi:MAG: EF-hand domain-containing protein [Candidatus Poseidoniaceae archaeon]
MESHDRDEDNPEEIFAMIDADGDGEVTASEWSDAANDSEDPMTDEDYQNLAMMLDAYDDDDSGGLNFAEFENMMEAMNDDGDNEDDPEMIFRMIDSNGDGEVTASEWSDATNNSEEPMSDEDYQNLAMMMDMYDDDESGGLNLAEFENMMGAMNDDDGEDVMEDMQMVMVMTVVDLHGDLDDYSVTLAMCDDDMVCEDDVYSVKLSDIAVTEDTFFFSGHSVMFMDMDESGTLNSGDMIMIDTSSLEVDEDWNTVRLHSEEANAYSDENPMPGFTGILATIGLLGAALIRRE